MKQLLNLFLALLFFTSPLLSQTLTDEGTFKDFLDKKEQRFDDISVLMGEANWNIYAKEGEVDLETPRKGFYALFTNDTLNASIDYWTDAIESIDDPILQRRITVWNRVLTGAKVDFSPDIYELEDKLETWLADEEIMEDEPPQEELEQLVLKLMKMRNKKAQELGFESYAHFQLSLQGLDPDFFFSVIDSLDIVTRKAYDTLITEFLTEREKVELSYADIRQLFYGYYRYTMGEPFNGDTLMQHMQQTVENIGIDYQSLPARFVVEDIPFGGNGLAIHIPDDFRAVLKPGMPITVWLHELGHGLQAMFNKTESPILKGYEWCLGNASPAFAEGMAELTAKLSLQPEWILKYTSKNNNDLAVRKSEMEKYFPVYIRFMLVRVMTEIEIYQNLDADPTEVRNELFTKYIHCQPPPDKVDFTSGGMFVSYPVYLQNYLLAEIISWQIHNTLREKFGDDYIFNKEIVTYLKENLWAAGEAFDWQEKLSLATGNKLNVKAYLEAHGLHEQ